MKSETSVYEGKALITGNRVIIPVIRRTSHEFENGVLVSAAPIAIRIKEGGTEYLIDLEKSG